VFRLNQLTAQIRMLLKNHSLRQLDEAYLRSLSHEALIRLSTKLVTDLKEARERLNQSPSNSSLPPSSQAPWVRDEAPEEAPEDEGSPPQAGDEPAPQAETGEKPQESVSALGEPQERPARKPGKQRGAPGYGRTQRLAVTETVHHRVEGCEGCGREAAAQTPWTAYLSLDIERGEGQALGIRVTHTKHLFYELRCPCGHQSRQLPYRGEDEGLWESIGLSEWRLVGPTLGALIVALSYRGRMSRARVQEFLRDWLGIELSRGTLQRSLEEAARAAAPVEEELVAQVLESALLHADETPHPQHGQPLWLWVFASPVTVLFYVGARTKEMIDNLLAETFGGWLMSDGYAAYRSSAKRLRCWAHLLRKAKGLEQSLDQAGRRFGADTTALLKTLMEAVYRAREGPGADLPSQYKKALDTFRAACEQAKASRHEKTRALAVEFLHDWEAIFRVLAHPHLPLTNNEAERALRHWVILRRITYGTRTPQGSRAFALLASIIDTCRKRQACPWRYLAEVIDRGRRGYPLPSLPVAGSPLMQGV
jgi:transposase